MKDIKSYVIGFLTCACLFLIMGQTKSDNQNGRYIYIETDYDDTTEMDYYVVMDTQDAKFYRAMDYRKRVGSYAYKHNLSRLKY